MLGCFYVAVPFITESLVSRAVVMLLITGAVLASSRNTHTTTA
jgi:hypothetical protein